MFVVGRNQEGTQMDVCLTSIPIGGHVPVRRARTGTYVMACTCGWVDRPDGRQRHWHEIPGQSDVVSANALDVWFPHTLVEVCDLFPMLEGTAA